MENMKYSKTDSVDDNSFINKGNYGNTEGYEAVGGYADTEQYDTLSNPITAGSNEPVSARNSKFMLGQYYVPENSKQISSGGQGRIYYCSSTQTDKVYVAKIYDKKNSDLEMVIKINDRLKHINHPNIANILDAGYTADNAYYMVVMEKYDEVQSDITLFKKYKDNIRELDRRFVNVLRDLNQGLTEIHRVNLYHADIKPTNIMKYKGYNNDERYVLIDFGGGAIGDISNDHGVDEGVSLPANMFTRGFQPPENFIGSMMQYKVNSKTDAYALGMTMLLLLTGVKPFVEELRYDSASVAEKTYLKENEGKGKIVYDVLLPANLPPYYVRFFQGTLYRTFSYTESKTYRWGDRQIAQWVTYVAAGDYDKAANMEYGDGNSKAGANQKENATKKRNKMYISYNNVDVQVETEAEMVDAFAKNWKETINNVMNNPQWVKSFGKLGNDVVQILINAGNQMKSQPENAELIFTKRVMERFASDEFKQYIFHNGTLYKDKKDLGKTIFAILSEKLKSGDDVELMTYSKMKQKKKNDRFYQMLQLFNQNYLSQEIEKKGSGWTMSSEAMGYIRDWEDRMNSQNPNSQEGKMDDLMKLMWLSYELQDKVAFEFNGKIYTEYNTFMKDLGDLSRTNFKKATELGKHCMENGRMKVAFYAWCMMVPDLPNRPDTNQKPL